MNNNIFIEVTNLNFKEILLSNEFQQNNNDYKHRNRYDRFCYHLVLNSNSNSRRAYFKNLIK